MWKGPCVCLCVAEYVWGDGGARGHGSCRARCADLTLVDWPAAPNEQVMYDVSCFEEWNHDVIKFSVPHPGNVSVLTMSTATDGSVITQSSNVRSAKCPLSRVSRRQGHPFRRMRDSERLKFVDSRSVPQVLTFKYDSPSLRSNEKDSILPVVNAGGTGVVRIVGRFALLCFHRISE